MKTKQLTKIALIVAITFISLKFLSVPFANNMIKTSVVVVFAFAVAFGGLTAGIGAGIAAVLFDITSPYAMYAPFSFVAYFLMGYIIGKPLEKEFNNQTAFICGFIASFVELFIYFIANSIFIGSTATALLFIPPEFFNCMVGIFVGIPLGKSLKIILSKSGA